MDISKRTIWAAIAALTLGIAILAFYLFGGFELFSGDEGIQQKERKVKSFTQFSDLFQYAPLPYSVDLANIAFMQPKSKAIDTNLVKEFIELNRYTAQDFNKLSDFTYFPVAKLNIHSNYLAFIILKTPNNGKFIQKYFLRIFDHQGSLRSQMQIAEFIGDTKFLNAREAVISNNYKMTISDKGVLFSDKCDSISSIFTTAVKDYKISSDGIIDVLTNAVK
jgi:hypothetical protein